MRAQTIIIGAVVFALVCAGFMTWILDMSSDYSVSFSDRSLEKLNKINDTYDFTVEMGEEIQSGSERIQQEGTNPLTASDQLWNGIKFMFNSLTSIPNMISTASDILEIPQLFVWTFLSIVLLVLVLGILVLLIGVVKAIA